MPKKQEQKIEDPNKLWDHAQSLEETKLWLDRQAEYEFMKDLIVNKLPGGDSEHLTDYFNSIEKAIYTKDPTLTNDKFSDFTSVDIDGAISEPPTDFKYFSADLLKQQAAICGEQRSVHAIEGNSDNSPITQSVEDSSSGCGSESIPDPVEVSRDISRMAISEGIEDDSYWDDDNYHSSR